MQRLTQLNLTFLLSALTPENLVVARCVELDISHVAGPAKVIDELRELLIAHVLFGLKHNELRSLFCTIGQEWAYAMAIATPRESIRFEIGRSHPITVNARVLEHVPAKGGG